MREFENLTPFDYDQGDCHPERSQRMKLLTKQLLLK